MSLLAEGPANASTNPLEFAGRYDRIYLPNVAIDRASAISPQRIFAAGFFDRAGKRSPSKITYPVMDRRRAAVAGHAASGQPPSERSPLPSSDGGRMRPQGRILEKIEPG